MIPALLYSKVFLYTVIILTIIVAGKLSNQDYLMIKRGNDNSLTALLLTLAFAIWIGLRPLHSIFGDSYYYAYTFNSMKSGLFSETVGATDWLWNSFSYSCSQLMSVSSYFTIVSLGYFLFTFWSCKKLIDNNVLAALLFVFGAFSFYSYSINGLRNGLACSICLFIIALLSTHPKKILIGCLLAFIAVNIHKSTLLPITTLLVSIYIVKSFKWAYCFWIFSILISLVAGGPISSFFAGLGFDERLSYIVSTSDSEKFSSTGFRWDFLLYSMMPIILGYYVVIKRGIQDRTYLILLNTYTLANAFWVMVIRASYSNRFAYLSWFIYPLVLAYPLFKLDIWDDSQGRRLSKIMLTHVGFTWFMSTFYY